MAKVIMVQGTTSDAGKSIFVTALCRIFKQDGFKVAPFKAQNMALNAFVTEEGGEMGRAQVVQAEAAGIAPSVHMNPILIKPEADSKSQVIIQGKPITRTTAAKYHKESLSLLRFIRESFDRLDKEYDVIVIEGAGSPAEINIRETEVANMRIALMAKAPVILVGDIDRGGVFASLIGTYELLNSEEQSHLKGFVINKFRGDASLLDSGLKFLKERTGIPTLGIVPYFRNIAIAQEDSMHLDNRINNSAEGLLDIVIVRIPRISNYDDFDPLDTPISKVRYAKEPCEIDGADLIIIPGSKSTLNDLAHLRKTGIADAILKSHKENDTPVIGICGGYQMLGRALFDPHKVESELSSTFGLGLLDANTTFLEEKSTTQAKGVITASCGIFNGMKGLSVIGYEIHMGRTENGTASSVLKVVQTPEGEASYEDGSINESGSVFGTYMHGIFDNTEFTLGIINNLREKKGLPKVDSLAISVDKQREYDKLALLMRRHVDIEAIYNILNDGV